MKVCSNAIQSNNDLFKAPDQKNTEFLNELKALKSDVNKYFDEEKDIAKFRNELLDFLNKGMGKLQNRTKQLGNEVKNIQNGLKEEHGRVKAARSATQIMKDLKHSDKRITETSNKVNTLEKEICRCLSRKPEPFFSSFVKEEDLVELRNGIYNVYGKIIQ